MALPSACDLFVVSCYEWDFTTDSPPVKLLKDNFDIDSQNQYEIHVLKYCIT